MWGIVPAAGKGSRIQPLAFSKELLPVGSRLDGGLERPCAVSEYLLERMVLAGADKICFVISPGKSDIHGIFWRALSPAPRLPMSCSRKPAGLCDALFRAAPLVTPEEKVIVGLPDTIWFPDHALRELPDDSLASCCSRSTIRSSSTPSSTRARRTCPRNPGKSRAAAIALDLGRVQDAGYVLHELHALWRARAREGRIFWHAGECISRRRRQRAGPQGRHAIMSTSARSAAIAPRIQLPRPDGRRSGADAVAMPGRSTSSWKCRSRTVSTQVLDRHRTSSSASQSARAVVSQHGSRTAYRPRRTICSATIRPSNGGASPHAMPRRSHRQDACSISAATAASTRSR